MTDVNEQSFSAGTTNDNAANHVARSQVSEAERPMWRFHRAAIQPSKVVRTIKTQIIPKIVLALRSAPAIGGVLPGKSTELNNIEQFTALTLGGSEEAALIHVESLVAQGMSVEHVFINVLAPSARQLGEMWESDTTDFANVSLAMSRMQRILRILAERSSDATTRTGVGESVLLTTIPGEQHSFGLSMVAEFFRRAGWNLSTGPFRSHQELTSLVHNHWFDVVGFSVSSDRMLDGLKRDVDEIRRDSCNKLVAIIIGGPMVEARPELGAAIGADMISIDATTAPQQARALVDSIKNRN
jgi:methanogenic corrinoid protein MtbC1